MTNESDGMNKMTAEYNVQRAELEASKAEVISEIEGAKNRIDVGISQGELDQVKTTINSHKVAQTADLDRLGQRKDIIAPVADAAISAGTKPVRSVSTPHDTAMNASARRGP